MNKIIPIRFAVSILTIIVSVVTPTINAAQKVISADGREVLLNDDGTWIYLSNDRLANTRDGKQVRLKDDGSWQYIGHTPLRTDDQVRTSGISLKLDRVVIETYEKKVQKNTRVRTQTIFYIDLQVASQTKNSINIDAQIIDNINVTDDKGEQYKILSVSPETEIKPGDNQMLVIRVDKSPSLWSPSKSMHVIFEKGLFGLPETITLSQETSDFTSLKVDGFEH